MQAGMYVDVCENVDMCIGVCELCMCEVLLGVRVCACELVCV